MYENKLLWLFFNKPMYKFHVRELGRITKLDTKTVMKYLKNFIKRKLVLRKKDKGFPYYEANRLSRLYRYEKSQTAVKKIFWSGLLEFLEMKLKPKVIVLFGSISKGTYHKKSDIDIFVQAKEKRLDLNKFEKKIGYDIKLFFEKNLNNLSKGLLNNIIQGQILSGNLDVFNYGKKKGV